MAPPRRRSDPSVIGDLAQAPRRYSFFQAVRLLELDAARRNQDERHRRHEPVGEDSDPRSEAVRFHSGIGLGFPSAEIAALQQGEDGQSQMEISFFGLTGALGALPEAYSALVQHGLKEKRPELRAFFDIFNHRLISLFYRAWAKYRLAPSFEQAASDGERDAVSRMIAALVGLEGSSLQDRMAIPDAVVLHHGGILSRRIRPVAAIEDILRMALELPVTVEQFRGQWCALDAEQQTILPSADQPEGQFCRLGAETVLGDRVWEIHGGLRLHIGPLDYAAFQDLMPGSAGARRLADLTAMLAGLQMDVDIQLLLPAEQAPPLRLDDGCGAQLGWNSWLPGGSAGDLHAVIFKL